MLSLPLLLSLTLPAASGPRTASEAGPSREQIRQAVERSLVSLEKGAADWMKGNNQVGQEQGRPVLVPGKQAPCASCHHVPMTFWCLTEAKNRGFVVKDDTIDEFRSWSLAPYLKDPNLQPFNQDKFGNAKTSLNTIYLTLALFPAQALDAQATEALKKFAAHLIAKQEADGSWSSGRTGYEPPIGDNGEVLTMQALLVLALIDQKGQAPDGWTDSRDRALAWLRKTKPGDSNQALNLRAQLAQRFGKPEEVAPLVKQLLETQNADGGWSQVKDRPSDALATGQTLYVLARLGQDIDKAEMRRGLAFLTRTQLKDGSWWVPSRDKGRKGLAISHYGSGWATLGLLQALPNAK
jgi:hypothetical protein